MKIKNIQTKKEYTMPRLSWEQLGKNQKLFKVLDDSDEDQIPLQTIDNLAKPSTGNITHKQSKNK